MNFSKYLKKSYSLFAIAITLTILSIALTLAYFVSLQKNDGALINKAGRQRMLSQRITKLTFYRLLENKEGIRPYRDQTLQNSVKQWESAQKILVAENKAGSNNAEIDSILTITGAQIQLIKAQTININGTSSPSELKDVASVISTVESRFLDNMEAVTFLLQKSSEDKNKLATTICFILTAIGLALIFAEFYFFVIPAHKQFKSENKDLEIVNRQLSDFAQITAHNLRSPIGNLIFLSNFYKEAESDEEKQELFEKFDKVIHHLDETIHVLLDGLKIQTKKEIKKETIYFENQLQIAKDLLVGEIIATKAVITSNFSQSPTIEYNTVFMESIMLNLVGNALKYSHADRAPLIHLSTHESKDSIKLYVEDNGLGIDLQRQGKKIFGLHQTFHRNKNSRGIGLFMTRNQIESLGGSIEVQSIPDKGSTFIVTFKK